MKLSYSSMRILHECPHNWVNKISGVVQPDSIYFKEGKIAHRIVQEHVADIKKHEHLDNIAFKFPIVETVDFDPNTKFQVPYKKHLIFGFVDGLDKPITEDPETLLELKFSSSPWGASKYQNDPQRKIYGWAIRSLREAILITGKRTPEEWRTTPLKSILVRFTNQDYQDAEAYMDFALDKIRRGDFQSDLVDGKCIDPRCYWGANCLFK